MMMVVVMMVMMTFSNIWAVDSLDISKIFKRAPRLGSRLPVQVPTQRGWHFKKM
jgi:hypothetical protein